LILSQSKEGVRHIDQLEFIRKVDKSYIAFRLFEVCLNLEKRQPMYVQRNSEAHSRYHCRMWKIGKDYIF